MTELYTMQRYLQYARLQELNMTHFGCWASRFGETVTAWELAPEGTGYRARTRFSKFFNLPELLHAFEDFFLRHAGNSEFFGEYHLSLIHI